MALRGCQHRWRTHKEGPALHALRPARALKLPDADAAAPRSVPLERALPRSTLVADRKTERERQYSRRFFRHQGPSSCLAPALQQQLLHARLGDLEG